MVTILHFIHTYCTPTPPFPAQSHAITTSKKDWCYFLSLGNLGALVTGFNTAATIPSLPYSQVRETADWEINIIMIIGSLYGLTRYCLVYGLEGSLAYTIYLLLWGFQSCMLCLRHPRIPRGRSWGRRKTGASRKWRRRGRGEKKGRREFAVCHCRCSHFIKVTIANAFFTSLGWESQERCPQWSFREVETLNCWMDPWSLRSSTSQWS